MNIFDSIISFLNKILLYKALCTPVLLFWIVSVSIFLTIKMKFINFRFFKEALDSIFFVQTSSGLEGTTQITPFTAFATQAAANLGLGNISGAAFAIQMAGPGVLFWIFVSSFFFSIIKFCEITLGHKYRAVNKDGTISGGLFYSIRNGLENKFIFRMSMKKTGIVIAKTSAILTFIVILSWSFFQLNQVVAVITNGKGAFTANSINFDVIAYTIIIMIFVTLVLIGGIKRIGTVSDFIVPFMALTYIFICVIVIINYRQNVFATICLIFKEAFSFNGIFGGCIFAIVVAMQRMMFATEAGAGTAAIIHANSEIKQSCKEGFISIIDCVIIASIICFGGFTILVSKIDYTSMQYIGIVIVDNVFTNVFMPLHYVLIIIVFLFGFTTIVGNGYYVQKSFGYIFGAQHERKSLYLFVILIPIVSFYESTFLVNLFDLFTLLLLIPNTIGILLLVNDVKEDLISYVNYRKS